MHDTPIRVDHTGIAVESVEAAEPVLAALGCEKLVDEEGPDGTFRWAYYELGDASRLELIEPLTEESFLRTFLDRHGPGLHHVTLEVADIEAVAAALEDAGLDVVDHTEHEGYTEAFVSPGNPTGALFQLMEYHEDYAERYDHPFVRGRRVSAIRDEAADPSVAGGDVERLGGDDAVERSDCDDGVEPSVADEVEQAVAERIAADPYCDLLGIHLLALAPGHAETGLTVTGDLLNFHGTVHGGAVYSLADAAFAAASNARGETALALETNTSYLEAVDEGTRLVATAEETHRSGRTAEYAVRVADGDDDRVATFRGRVYLP